MPIRYPPKSLLEVGNLQPISWDAKRRTSSVSASAPHQSNTFWWCAIIVAEKKTGFLCSDIAANWYPVAKRLGRFEAKKRSIGQFDLDPAKGKTATWYATETWMWMKERLCTWAEESIFTRIMPEKTCNQTYLIPCFSVSVKSFEPNLVWHTTFVADEVSLSFQDI